MSQNTQTDFNLDNSSQESFDSDKNVLNSEEIEEDTITDNSIITSDNEIEDIEIINKVYMSKEDAEAECKMQTHDNLIKLGSQLQQIKSKEEGLKKLYDQLEEKFKDLPKFDLDSVDTNFNLDSYLYLKFKDNTGFKIIDAKELYQVYMLFQISKHNFNLVDKDNKILQTEINDLNDQGDEYIKQLEDLENQNLEKDQKLANRIINLRQKCIDRRRQIKYMWGLIMFLCYCSIFSWNTVLFQIIYLFVNFIFPISVFIFNGVYKSFNITFAFLMENKLILGGIISSLITYVYLKLNILVKKEKKEN